MLKSMTAYGRGIAHGPRGQFMVEIQSLNRKHLDINCMLPREFGFFDVEVKKWLVPFVGRGQVTVKLAVALEGDPPFVIRPNLPLARQLKHAWDLISEELQLEESFSLKLLKGTEGLLNFDENREEEDAFREFVRTAFEQALKGFIQMKSHEGSLLESEIVERLKKMSRSMKQIESRSSHATKRYREKLIERLEEVLPGRIENEERILREVALFAEKIDISEEITRFNCHLAHFEEVVKSEETSVGKTLEFIVQELNREANTIGSKSSELEIAHAVIEIKSELEKIREQLQNVE